MKTAQTRMIGTYLIICESICYALLFCFLSSHPEFQDILKHATAESYGLTTPSHCFNFPSSPKNRRVSEPLIGLIHAVDIVYLTVTAKTSEYAPKVFLPSTSV